MHVRHFRWDDLPEVMRVMNAFSLAVGGRGDITVEVVEANWRKPYNHPERDCFVAEDAEGRLLGYTIADLLDDPQRAVGVYCVPPGNPSASRMLVDAATQYFQQTAFERCPPDAPITLLWHIPEQAVEAVALFEEDGVPLVRVFYTMHIALETPVTPLAPPEGLTLRPFTPDMLETLYAATEEAFIDHWGETNLSLDEWRQDIAAPGFDPSVWWVAWAGEQIAGMVLSRAITTEKAWVGIVGVRRPWRKRGLAHVLLQTCFAEYQRRGFRQVELGVDSDSSTRAVSVYERAGMHIRRRTLYYEWTRRG